MLVNDREIADRINLRGAIMEHLGVGESGVLRRD
jgi:hypothetical protein